MVGICALTGCFFIKPRLCRYIGEDTMVFEEDSEEEEDEEPIESIAQRDAK